MNYQKTFNVKYYRRLPDGSCEFSHQYVEPWLLADLHCPGCGAQKVWFCDNGGDYYVGELHICTGCGVRFYLPLGVKVSDDEQDKQRLANLMDECDG